MTSENKEMAAHIETLKRAIEELERACDITRRSARSSATEARNLIAETERKFLMRIVSLEENIKARLMSPEQHQEVIKALAEFVLRASEENASPAERALLPDIARILLTGR